VLMYNVAKVYFIKGAYTTHHGNHSYFVSIRELMIVKDSDGLNLYVKYFK